MLASPPVDVSAGPGAGGHLPVTIEAMTSGSTPNNALESIRFGGVPNTLIEVPGQPAHKGNVTLTLPPGTRQLGFNVKRDGSGPITAPLVIKDVCGDWRTFGRSSEVGRPSSDGSLSPFDRRDSRFSRTRVERRAPPRDARTTQGEPFTRTSLMRLVLWDVDGTLIRARALLGDAWDQALATVFQLEGELARVEMAGKTDSQIALEVLALHGWTDEHAIPHLDHFHEAYVAGLHEVREILADHIDVLAGAPAILDRLTELGVRQSLLTGNYEAAARLKLGSVNLDHHLDFEVGAFGSDHRDRLQLVPVAVEKCRRLRDPGLTVHEVIVVGDTPRDIACARAGGARAVAVATGPFSAELLAQHTPDALLTSLADTEVAVRAILGHRV